MSSKASAITCMIASPSITPAAKAFMRSAALPCSRSADAGPRRRGGTTPPAEAKNSATPAAIRMPRVEPPPVGAAS